jgi:hypothetical protein
MRLLKIDQVQFGAKVGRHMLDFGRDPAKASDRKWLMDHITTSTPMQWNSGMALFRPRDVHCVRSSKRSGMVLCKRMRCGRY